MANTETAAAAADEELAPTKEKFNIRTVLPFLGLALIVIVFAFGTGGRLVQPNNLMLILNQTYTIMIPAIGVFMIMSMGSLDFSQGSMIGLACIVVCTLSKVNPVLAIIGGILTGALVGLVNAFFHVYCQIASFIVTNCMMFLLRGIIGYLTTTSPAMAAGWMQPLFNTPMPLIVTLICLVAFWFVWTFTPLGANLRAIGASQTAARFAGIKVNKTKTLVFVAAGAITGFAAFLLACRNGSVTSSGGNMQETIIMLALVLGGLPVSGGAKVRFYNIPVGVITYCVLDKGLAMMGFETAAKQLITGIVFLIFLAVFTDRESNQVIK